MGKTKKLLRMLDDALKAADYERKRADRILEEQRVQAINDENNAVLERIRKGFYTDAGKGE